MKPSFGLAALAVLQLTVALALLYWAAPLFFDPPVLGNGIDGAAQHLHHLSSLYPQEFKRIDWVGAHLKWLFNRHTEGVLVALAASAVTLCSAAATAFFAFALQRTTPNP